MCRSSRVIIFRFNSKTLWQMFLLLYGRHIYALRRAQTWLLHTKLYKFAWHTSAKNAQMKRSRDLILGEVVVNHLSYPRFLTYFIEWLWFFAFDHMTGENRELIQIVGTGLNNVCACARCHGSRCRRRPGHHKPRKNGGVFRIVPGLWWKGRATLKTVERNFYTRSLDHWSAHTFLYTGV